MRPFRKVTALRGLSWPRLGRLHIEFQWPAMRLIRQWSRWRGAGGGFHQGDGHRSAGSKERIRFDRPTARTHRLATRRAGDQAITSRRSLGSHQSLMALADQNDPDDWHEANRYGRPDPSPCSEAGLAFRGPFRLLWPRLLRLAAKAAAIQFPVSCFPVHVSGERKDEFG